MGRSRRGSFPRFPGSDQAEKPLAAFSGKPDPTGLRDKHVYHNLRATGLGLLAFAGSQLLEYQLDFACLSPSRKRRRASEMDTGGIVGKDEATRSGAVNGRIPDRLAKGNSPCSVAVIKAGPVEAATLT